MRLRGVAILVLVAVAGCGGGGGKAPAVASAATSTAALKVRDEAASWHRRTVTAFAAAHDGQRLALGDTVRTNGTGFVDITYDDGSLTRLDADAEFTLTDLSRTKQAQRVVGRLSGGRAWSHVERLTSSESRYEIDTDVATASVRGTEFDVDCTAADRSCTFAVVEGTVAVTPRSGGAAIVVHAGESLTVRPPGVAATVEPLVTSPWIDRNVGLDHGGTTTSTTTPVAGAGAVAGILYVEYFGGPHPEQGGMAVQIDCVRGRGCTMRDPFTGAGDPRTGTPGIVLQGGHWRAHRDFDQSSSGCGGTATVDYDLVPQGTTTMDGVDVPARLTGTYHLISRCPQQPDDVQDVRFDSPPLNVGTGDTPVGSG